ncbi:hypothetical protein HK097_000470 [Rhizophlyctis rosea]|uniref:Uncharacterized protein n=1 Tax=Rhizophlyctis rosea TaxID=64517 RepID=A0AAD5SI36_9FUNG|nr:hypothetical protein HK097_000470 [Rhizophlyctis rosea]
MPQLPPESPVPPPLTASKSASRRPIPLTSRISFPRLSSSDALLSPNLGSLGAAAMYLGGEGAAAGVGLPLPRTAPAAYGTSSGNTNTTIGVTLTTAFRPPSPAVAPRAATAPDVLYTDLVNKYRPPTIAEATLRQNRRLERTMRTADAAMQPGMGRRGGWGRRDATARTFHEEGIGFDKSLTEIMKLLDRARTADEKPSSTSVEASPKKRKPGDTSQPGADKHQRTLFDLVRAAEGTPLQLAGRKPMRLIAAELEKRIERLKTNQQEWEAFQGLILEYKHADAAHQPLEHIDAIRQNKVMLQYLYPEHKRKVMEELKDSHEQHRQDVHLKKQRMDRDRREKWEEVLRRKDETAEQSRRKEKDEMGRAALVQKKWFILTVVASRLGMFKAVLDELHARKRNNMIINHAARVIQKAYRRYKQKEYEEKQRRALMQIAGAFKIYVHRRRQRAKHNASNTIRQFFKEVHDVSKLMKIVKKYRFSVVKAQGYVRSFHIIRDAQVQVISMAWSKAESEWWANRKRGGAAFAGGMKKAASKDDLEDKKEKKGKKGKGKKKEDSVVAGVALKVPEHIKSTIILEDLIRRRKAHRAEVTKYAERLEAYNAAKKKRLVVPTIHRLGGDAGKEKSGEGDDSEAGPPKWPLFKLIPPPPDMYALIEKGFLESMASGK